jgi:hypothetical protein
VKKKRRGFEEAYAGRRGSDALARELTRSEEGSGRLRGAYAGAGRSDRLQGNSPEVKKKRRGFEESLRGAGGSDALARGTHPK